MEGHDMVMATKAFLTVCALCLLLGVAPLTILAAEAEAGVSVSQLKSKQCLEIMEQMGIQLTREKAAKLDEAVLKAMQEVLGPNEFKRVTEKVTDKAPEQSVVGDMESYSLAQLLFRRTDWDGDGKLQYAKPFTLLHLQTGKDGKPLQLINAAFVGAKGSDGQPWHGYLFQDMRTMEGKAIKWNQDFALCATPEQYGKTGKRTFIVCTNGTVFGKDLGKAEFVTDFPADPIGQGWNIAEGIPSTPTPPTTEPPKVPVAPQPPRAPVAPRAP